MLVAWIIDPVFSSQQFLKAFNCKKRSLIVFSINILLLFFSKSLTGSTDLKSFGAKKNALDTCF